MKTKSTLLMLSGLALLSLSACFSPRPVVRVEPIEEPQRWNYGQAILEAEKNGITANAAFAYSDDDFLVFDVEVTNWREERILVDPAGIQLDVNSATSMYIPAIDPEEQMLGMEMDASRREANAKNAAVVAGVVAVAAVAAAVATSSNDNNNNENNFNNDGVDVVNVAPTLVLGAGAGGAPPPGPIAVDPWFWSDQTLRKTTLEKGQQVRGKVLFPRNDQIRNFEMSVPVEELIFTFEFRQVLHRP